MPIAVLVPQTALLVPGAAGRADVLAGVRSAALEATGDLVATEPRRVLLVAPADRDRLVDAAEVCASLTGLGIAERHVGWTAPCRLPGCPEHTGPGDMARRAGTAGAVGLRLLAAAGWQGPTTLQEVSPEAGPGSAPWDAVLVLGSLSARHGEHAPRAADPRAAGVDAELATALADPTPEHLDRLAMSDPALARELDVGGAAPWRVLAGLVAGRHVTGRLEAADDSLGVDHRVWTWRWER